MKSKSISKEKKNQKDINYQSAESIVKIILDKIITLTIRKSYANKINLELGEYCFDFIKNNIYTMFEPYYIAHTKESKNKKINKNELFLNIKQPVNNTWIEIIEPEFFQIDRYEGANIKFKEIERNENESEKSLAKSTKKTKNENLKHNFANNKINNNIVIKSSKNLKIDITDKNNNTNINTNKLSNKKDNNINKEKNNIQNSSNTGIQNKNRKIQMIDLPYEDIQKTEEDNIDQYNLPEVEKLRREFQEELNKKEEEKKKIKEEEEKEKKLRTLLNEKKNDKIFDSKKLTFDSNGKIISFKQFRIDNLKDFIIPKNFIKEKKKNVTSNTSSKKKLKNNDIVSKTPIKKIKLKEENIIKDSKMEYKKKLIESPVEKIIPSGSNFQLISPNVGVVIVENGQSKEGPRDFSKHFKKYSLKDYDDIFNNYLPKINRNFQKTKFENSSKRASLRNNVLNLNNIIKNTQSNVIKRNSIEINNNDEESLTYNPLMTSPNKENNNITLEIPKKSQILSIKSNFRNSNPLLSSYNINSSNLNNNLYTTNFDKFITMKKEGMGPLKLELDSLKDLSEINTGLYKNSLTTRYNDFIGNKFRIKNNSLINKNTNYKNYFGDFNKKILENKRWGNDISPSISYNNTNTNTVYAKHQTKIQVLRELGSNILNGLKIKLPRKRKVDLVIK